MIKSKSLYHSLTQLIPGGVNSPVRAFKSVGAEPIIIQSAKGDRILDVDGKSYIDFCASWGAMIHGHAHPVMVDALKDCVEKGTSYGITCEGEEKLARIVTQFMPSIEKIRFVSSGTEATMSAIRLARGFSGRDLIVKFTGCYHGHADHLLVRGGSGLIGLTSTASSEGVPKDFVRHTASLPYNDSETVRKFLQENQVAAVIVEPIAGNMGVVPADAEFLKTLREETEKTGALLIFDEVITGFRVRKGGAQELYGIKPDLTCLGKIVGGGLPVGAFGGRKEIMDYLAPLGPVYQAGTLSGNPIAMEAGYQALKLLEVDGFYEKLEEKTKRLTDPIQEVIAQKGMNACLQRVGSMFTLFFGRQKVTSMVEDLDTEVFAKLFRSLLDQGIYIPPSQHESWFVTAAHSEESLRVASETICTLLIRDLI